MRQGRELSDSDLTKKLYYQLVKTHSSLLRLRRVRPGQRRALLLLLLYPEHIAFAELHYNRFIVNIAKLILVGIIVLLINANDSTFFSLTKVSS